MSEVAIEVRGLSKRYGGRMALSDLSLTVPTGSFFAVLGRNGAGKTTLLRILTGMIRPDAGEGHVLGFRLGAGFPSLSLKERIGYVAQQPALYDRMTATELIRLCRGVHAQWDDAIVKRYLELFELPAGVQVRHMSTGMKAQLALTLVMGGNPELLILDEPTLGLDPLNRHQYMQVLLADSMEVGRTVLLSSHDLHQIERLADSVAILREGKVVVSGALDDLKLTEKRVRVAGVVDEEALRRLPGLQKLSREANGWLLAMSGETERLRAAIQGLPGVTGVQVFDQSLEEIFLSHVS